MRTIHVADSGFAAAAEAVRRSNLQENPKIESIVREIVANVQSRGNAALLELGQKFDSPNLSALEVTPEEWQEACEQIDAATREAVEIAAANITDFHERQKRQTWMHSDGGKVTGQLINPLQKVGVYVPGGTAAYPSSVLMCALPAKVAGVEHIYMCTPAQKNGKLLPLVLYAARVAGVERVFKIGGAQAIAAFAFGTESVPAVDKVVGPGNLYVNVAKRYLFGIVDIDMLAGPSEVCVVADGDANAEFAAADMLTQAEHDVESAAYLITPSKELAKEVVAALASQMEHLPRKAILAQGLEENGAIIITESLDQAFELANLCAPEHLALMVAHPFEALGRIRNAGAILMGGYSPQTLGDYAAGPSHTLPTSGTARFSSPLNVDTFMKKTSFIHYNREALEEIAPVLERFAAIEGFEAHAAAVRIRLEEKRID